MVPSFLRRRRLGSAIAVMAATLIASRVSGTAPLLVHFDMTGTTSAAVTAAPFDDILYTINFGETAGPGIGTWPNGSRAGASSRNVAYGPVAGHVFETPGIYVVTATAFDGVNTGVPQSVTITVADPNVTFAGANTVCVSTAGNFASAPPGATQVTIGTAAFATAMGNKGDGKRLLFQTGETWNTSASEVVAYNTATGGQIGSFGGGAAPIIRRTAGYTAADTTLAFSGATTPNMRNWVVYGLNFDHSLIPIEAHVAVGQAGGLDDFLALRITGTATGRVFLNSSNALDIYNSGGNPGHHIWTVLGVVDCLTASIPVGSAGTTSTWPYGSYISADKLFFAGNNFQLNGSNVAGTSHVARFPYLGKGVISNNTLAGAGPSEHCIKLHAPDPNLATVLAETAGLGSGSTRWVVISDNLCIPNYGGQPVAIGPQSDSVNEVVKDIIFERNWVYFAQVPVSQTDAVMLRGPFQIARNNRVNVTLGIFPSGITVTRRSAFPAPNPNYCKVYSNDIYYNTANTSFTAINVAAGTLGARVKNNLGYAPNDSNHVMLNDLGTSTVASNNSTTAQVGATDPLFTGVLTAMAGWSKSAGSYTKNAGVAVPNWQDFNLVARPVGASMDIGSTEQ